MITIFSAPLCTFPRFFHSTVCGELGPTLRATFEGTINLQAINSGHFGHLLISHENKDPKICWVDKFNDVMEQWSTTHVDIRLRSFSCLPHEKDGTLEQKGTYIDVKIISNIVPSKRNMSLKNNTNSEASKHLRRRYV